MDRIQIAKLSEEEYYRIRKYMEEIGFGFHYDYVVTNRAINYIYTYVYMTETCEDRIEIYKRITPCDINDKNALMAFLRLRNNLKKVTTIPVSNLNPEQQ